MGALIQTKGTQLLSQFFSNQFGPGASAAGALAPVNLDFMRAVGGLAHDFQLMPSLFALCEKYSTPPTYSIALFYPFPSILTSAGTASGNNVLTFGNNNVPPWVNQGSFVVDDDTPGAIPPNTTATASSATTVTISTNVVKAISSGDKITFINYVLATLQTSAGSNNQTLSFNTPVPASVVNGMMIVDLTTPAAIQATTAVTGVPTASSVTISLAAQGVLQNDVIAFLIPTGNHQNLQRRWKYYLQNELQPQCDAAIRAAILRSIVDTKISRIQFDVIEGTKQAVHAAIEADAAADKGTLTKTKYTKIVLETPPTQASVGLPVPIPLDDQFKTTN